MSLKKKVATEEDELTAEYTIFPIIILTKEWNIVLDTKTCQGITAKKRRKPTTP